MSRALWLSIDDADPVETNLDRFFGDNEFAPEERAEIALSIADGGLHFGGGGAGPEWVIGTPPAVSAWLAGVGS